MMANQTQFFRLEQSYANHGKFTEEWVMYEEVRFIQESFTNGLKIGLPVQVWVDKTVHEVEILRLSGKETITGSSTSKEDYAEIL